MIPGKEGNQGDVYEQFGASGDFVYTIDEVRREGEMDKVKYSVTIDGRGHYSDFFLR